MTWVKPSFAWVLYRSGYASKHNKHAFKIKISHESLAHILEQCKCKEGGGSHGRVQWDPARDLHSSAPNGREPRKMLKQRAIQIGMGGPLSQYYTEHIISIQDVTELAKQVQQVHKKTKNEDKEHPVLLLRKGIST